MPRRKTFRKRRQKRVQKGGAPPTIQGINAKPLPDFNDTPTKYYGMVRKTRKNTGGNSTGGGDDDIDYESFIVNEEQKKTICADSTDNTKIMVEDTSKVGDSFTQFYENEDKEELITFFEFTNGAGENTKLDDLKIDKVENINWANFVGC